MPHYWLTYGDADGFVGAVITAGLPFAEGHELSAKLIALVPPTKIGRMLSRTETMQLIRDLQDHTKR